MKNNTSRERDMHGTYVYHPLTKDNVFFQKKLICVCEKDLLKLMLKPVTEGGYVNSRDIDGRVKLSLHTIKRY